MKVTVSFGNPFAAAIYSVVLLMIGWAIGAQWGHTLTAGWMLFQATILLFVHDAVIVALLMIALAKMVPSSRK